MKELTGKMVEVGTVGLVYEGKLIETGESEVLLDSGMGWVSIPMDRIVFIREKEENSPPFLFP